MSNGVNTTVVALQGRPVAATTPTANQVLQFSGTQWVPTTLTAGTGTVTSIAPGNGLTTSPTPITGAGTIALASPVAISNGGTNATTASAALANLGGISGNQTITLSGDISGAGTTAITTTLPNVNANVGTFQGITINAKGQITGAVNQNYVTGGPYLPLTGGTLTGPLTITGGRLSASGAFTIGGDNYPTLGIHEALTVTGSNPGVHGAPWFFNVADTMAVGASTWWASFVITHNFDASVGTGHREPLLVTMQTANGVANQNYVSAQFNSELTSGSGNVFGINPYVQIDATAGASAVAVGAEIDTDIRVNVLGKACLQLADIATSTGVGPLGYDCALLTERQSGAAGYAVGLQFGRYGGGVAIAGSNGVKQTGTILQVIPGSNVTGQPDFAYGIDFRSTTITSAAFASPGFIVDPAGNVGFSNATSNWIVWNTSALGPPTYTTRSVGTKLVLASTIGSTSTDSAIGLASGYMWFSGSGYQWWNLQTTSVMSLDASGNLIAISTVRAGTPTAPTGGYAIGDINGQRLLLNGTPLGTIATQNANAVAITGGTVNGASVGATTTSTGAFTTLSASGAASFTNSLTASPANQSVTFSPTGTGTLTINPATLGHIDNTAIGATTASTGAFTTLSAASTVSGAGFTTLLAPYAPLASPALTGTPTIGGAPGSLTVGGPTGGSSGAGTINVASAYYVNNRNVTPGAIHAVNAFPNTVPAQGPSGMQGLAIAFTPASSTRVLVVLTGSVTVATASAAVGPSLRYGTGTAPVYGAAQTGTQVYSCQVGNSLPTGAQLAVPLIAVVTGLTIGTAYWFDVYMNNSTGNSNFFAVGYSFLEV